MKDSSHFSPSAQVNDADLPTTITHKGSPGPIPTNAGLITGRCGGPPIRSACIYARYSSANQNDCSIEQQVQAIQQYAKAHGITIAAVYADRALSGTTDARPEFQRMIRDASKGNWQAVLTWKLDRFARNRYDFAIYKAKLKQAGVHLISIMEPLAEGNESIILESMLEGMAEYYSANLSENVRRGLAFTAQQGKAIGHRAFGYRNVDGYWQADPDEAETVRQIFQWCIDGTGARLIAMRLNAMGIRTIMGKEFCDPSVRKILRNDMYTGVYHQCDTRIEGGVPAIISRETFEAAQKAMAVRSAAGTHARPVGGVQRYLLTGRAVCGLCGRPMVGSTSGAVGPGGSCYQYYTCGGRHQGLTCAMKKVRADKLEAMVLDSIRSDVLGDLGTVADEIIQARKPAESESLLAGLRTQLKDHQTAISNILKAIEAGAWSPALNDRLADLEREKGKIEAAIREAESARGEVNREDIVNALALMTAGDWTDRDFQRKLIAALVERVTVWPDRVDVAIRIGEGFAPTETTPRCGFARRKITATHVYLSIAV